MSLAGFLVTLLTFAIAPWAYSTREIAIPCPPPLGNEAADPGGILDPVSVSAAMGAAYWTAVIIVALLLAWCYFGSQATTGPRFVKRWWIHLMMAAGASGAAATLILWRMPVRALAGSCSTNPDAFAQTLPADLIVGNGLGALLFAAVLFVVLALAATQTLGRYSWSSWLYHNRGVPWPRLVRPRGID